MATTNWALDASHSEIQFKVRHMMISNVSGSFQRFDASLTTEGTDLATAKVRFTAEVASITTNNEQRDGHLHSADFFDLENNPQLIFESEGMEKVDDENYRVHGTLTLRGVTKPITLDVEASPVVKDPWGNERIGFVLTGKINRKDFGVSWGAVTEAGGIVVSDQVSLHCAVEFIKQAA